MPEEGSSEFKFVLDWDSKPAANLWEGAQKQRSIYGPSLEKRVFGNLPDSDLIVLMLNPSLNAKHILGDKELYQRAVQVFTAQFHAVEAELELPRRTQAAPPTGPTAPQPRNRTNAPDLLALGKEETGPATDVSVAKPKEQTRLEEFEALRKDFELIARYTVDRQFKTIAFYSAEGSKYPVPKRMFKRNAMNLASEGVSESTFSIHAQFASDLRQSLDAAYISDMVFCNVNHSFLYPRIKHKVYERYVQKFQGAE